MVIICTVFIILVGCSGCNPETCCSFNFQSFGENRKLPTTHGIKIHISKVYLWFSVGCRRERLLIQNTERNGTNNSSIIHFYPTSFKNICLFFVYRTTFFHYASLIVFITSLTKKADCADGKQVPTVSKSCDNCLIVKCWCYIQLGIVFIYRNK